MAEYCGGAGALGGKQPLHDRHRMGRGHADRLVQHHPAMHVALVAPGLALITALVARIIVSARTAFLLPPPLRGRAGEGGSRECRTLWLTPLPALLRSADPRSSRGQALPLKGGGGRNISAAHRIIFVRAVRLIVLRIDCDAWRRHGHHVSSDSGLRSRCTAGVLSNFSIRSASSNRSSTRKRRSGANFRLTRCAISPRRNFLLRSSAASTNSVSRPPSGIT